MRGILVLLGVAFLSPRDWPGILPAWCFQSSQASYVAATVQERGSVSFPTS